MKGKDDPLGDPLGHAGIKFESSGHDSESENEFNDQAGWVAGGSRGGAGEKGHAISGYRCGVYIGAASILESEATFLHILARPDSSVQQSKNLS